MEKIEVPEIEDMQGIDHIEFARILMSQPPKEPNTIRIIPDHVEDLSMIFEILVNILMECVMIGFNRFEGIKYEELQMEKLYDLNPYFRSFGFEIKMDMGMNKKERTTDKFNNFYCKTLFKKDWTYVEFFKIKGWTEDFKFIGNGSYDNRKTVNIQDFYTIMVIKDIIYKIWFVPIN